jgi:aspartyl-tRNA(Asn)/glutamyl-tRNA(Gln) amidotransferase subunit B
MYRITGSTGEWEVVIGLEIHAQVTSKAKLFSGSDTTFGAEPNTQVSFIDAAMPGMLPVLNEFCVEQAVRTGLGLGAKINLFSAFDRKNYFYPDLPQGYQISQFYHPIVGEGTLTINVEGKERKIGIERLHLEQDAGKSMHDQSPDSSYIDLNRCGIALMEIVSAPDLRSPKEAAEYVKKIRAIVRCLETCDGDMDKGSMRCDANVSVRKVGDTNLNNRCEIKNLNSMRYIMKSIEYEAERQVDIYEAGGEVDQETRLFDTETGKTRTMRSKEDAMDYRYFPDPDLMPIVITEDYIQKIRDSLPELPEEKQQRYINDLNLSPYDAEILTLEKETSIYFEEVIKNSDAKMASNWIAAELFGRLNKAGIELSDCKVTPAKLSGLLKLISTNVISGKIAKEVFDIMFESGEDAAKIVEDKGLQQVTNTDEIEAIISQVLQDNEEKVAEYKSGRDKLFGFFVGQVMKISKGKANPALVNELLVEKLK